MERKEVETQYRWKTEDIFGSDEAWEAAFAALETLPDVSSFRGNLNTAENVAAYFALTDAYEIRLMRVYLYAFLKHDEDVRVTKYNAYVAKVMSLFTRYGAETSFAVPELTALPEETLAAIAADERLKDYDYSLKRLIAHKRYVLSEKEELFQARLWTAIFTAATVVIALFNDYFGGVTGLILSWFAALLGPTAIPLIFGLFPCFKYSDGKAAVISTIAGLGVFVLTKCGIQMEADVAIAAPLFVSAFFYIGIGLINKYVLHQTVKPEIEDLMVKLSDKSL